jgi:hypothetical protein
MRVKYVSSANNALITVNTHPRRASPEIVTRNAPSSGGYGLELDPAAYVDVILRRWQRLTGRDATHDSMNAPGARSRSIRPSLER